MSFRLQAKVKAITNKTKLPKVMLTINGVKTQVLVDTGLTINVLYKSRIFKMKPKPQMQRT